MTRDYNAEERAAHRAEIERLGKTASTGADASGQEGRAGVASPTGVKRLGPSPQNGEDAMGLSATSEETPDVQPKAMAKPGAAASAPTHYGSVTEAARAALAAWEKEAAGG